jgi:N-acetylneuraminic acid mutarotase
MAKQSGAQLTRMKKQADVAIKTHMIKRRYYLLLLVAGAVPAFAAPTRPVQVSSRALSFAERVSYQRAIEEVYWQHRIWPKENVNPKPSLDAVMSQAQLERKVEDYLRGSQVVADSHHQAISAEQLQGEMDRMAQHTQQPEVLGELFEALNNDPFVIAECLARPLLSERIMAELHLTRAATARARPQVTPAASTNYTLPTIWNGATGCTDDTWAATTGTNAPVGRYGLTTVWTGSEMIVWGGSDGKMVLNTGGRYNPSTDSWTATSTTNAAQSRYFHTAVWTGIEMIVWGGETDIDPFYLNNGGRYDPGTDNWTPLSTTNAPSGRYNHTVVWTGSEMIVWGGFSSYGLLDSGGRYNPGTDTSTATSITNAPSARFSHTAVWTGSEMIIWGGDTVGTGNTAAQYNPSADTWTTISTVDAPPNREGHTAVWTGSEMIIWGGDQGGFYQGTGVRYNAARDSWTRTSTTNAPEARSYHTAVWTGSEMIVWGGNGLAPLSTGGRYNPTTDSWSATSTTNAPPGALDPTGVWTGEQMIVWGGEVGYNTGVGTGGRYCASTAESITLTAQKKRVQGINSVRLTWSGATSENIDVYRNGVVVATTANDGSYDDVTADTGRAQYTYIVCEAATSTCSTDVVVRFSR